MTKYFKLFLLSFVIIYSCTKDSDTLDQSDIIDSFGTINILLSHENCNAPCEIMFESVINLNLELESISWEFGDGNTSNEQNPSHSYEDEGIYQVKLEVIDISDSIYITIRQIVVEFDLGVNDSLCMCSGEAQFNFNHRQNIFSDNNFIYLLNYCNDAENGVPQLRKFDLEGNFISRWSLNEIDFTVNEIRLIETTSKDFMFFMVATNEQDFMAGSSVIYQLNYDDPSNLERLFITDYHSGTIFDGNHFYFFSCEGDISKLDMDGNIDWELNIGIDSTTSLEFFTSCISNVIKLPGYLYAINKLDEGILFEDYTHQDIQGVLISENGEIVKKHMIPVSSNLASINLRPSPSVTHDIELLFNTYHYNSGSYSNEYLSLNGLKYNVSQIINEEDLFPEQLYGNILGVYNYTEENAYLYSSYYSGTDIYKLNAVLQIQESIFERPEELFDIYFTDDLIITLAHEGNGCFQLKVNENSFE